MSIFAFDPVNPLLHICLDCTRSKSNGIDVIPPMPNGRSLASTKGTAIFLQKKSHLACYSKQRSISLFLWRKRGTIVPGTCSMQHCWVSICSNV